MSRDNNSKDGEYKFLSDHELIRANSILYEYFRNNRYPKRIEKLKLAEKAGVTLQFVINFFYNTRSRIKHLERRQSFLENRNRSLYFSKEPGLYYRYPSFLDDAHNPFCFRSPEHGISILNGMNNSLYKSLPIVSPTLLNEFRMNHDNFCSKIQMFEDGNIENMNNMNESY